MLTTLLALNGLLAIFCAVASVAVTAHDRRNPDRVDVVLVLLPLLLALSDVAAIVIINDPVR